MTPRLLLVFAHPDDESVFAGGVACQAAAAGGIVALCTATLGDRGRAGSPPVCEPGEVGRVRQDELVTAARIIGVTTLRVLGYPDRGLCYAPSDTIRRQLVEVIRAVRPHVVVTFDPNGSNLHPDHVAISRFAGDAVSAAADPRWHPDTGRPWSVPRLVWTLPIRPWRLLETAEPSQEPGVDFVVDVSAHAATKEAALRAHRTQHVNLERIILSRPNRERLLGTELFRHAWGPPPSRRPSPDLFDGITPEKGPGPFSAS